MTLEEAWPRDGVFLSVLAGNTLVPAQVKDGRIRLPRARILVPRSPGECEGVRPQGDWKVKAVQNLGPPAKVHRSPLSCSSGLGHFPQAPFLPL